jgi:hypothetical protein
VLIDHPGVFCGQDHIQEASFPDKKSYRDVPAMKHFSQFHTYQSTSGNHGMMYVAAF